MKEIAELFDVNPRTVRRWVNEEKLISPLRKGSSTRVLDTPEHEIVRLYILRRKEGKSVSQAVARRLGLEPLLAEAERRFQEDAPLQKNPSNFHVLFLRLLAETDQTKLAMEQGKTPLELSALTESARALLRGVLANPASRTHLVEAFREALLIEASCLQESLNLPRQ